MRLCGKKYSERREYMKDGNFLKGDKGKAQTQTTVMRKKTSKKKQPGLTASFR